MAANNEQNGHHTNNHHQQPSSEYASSHTAASTTTPIITKRITKTRSSPRPTSIGTKLASSSTPIHYHHHHHHRLHYAEHHHGGGRSTSTASSPPPSHSQQPIKPQSWSETTNAADYAAPIGSNPNQQQQNRGVRIRDKLRPVSAAMTGKLRQQRERRRAKRREPYMPSTEGTSTGDEGEVELFQMDNIVPNASSVDDKQGHHRYSLNQPGECTKKGPPPATASRRYSSPIGRRLSKSPSDLDADDEDNQDYDSASMISASEISAMARVRGVPPPRNNSSNADEDAVFNAQFQEIRMAGMQQLAEIDANTGPSDLADGDVEHVAELLETERREKSALIHELGQKEQRIYEMEKTVVDLNRRLTEYGLENEHLKAENRALLQAMAKLSAE